MNLLKKYSKSEIRNVSLNILFTLLFPPVISLAYYISRIGKFKINAIIFSFLIALLGLYWFPWGDSQSHFFYYDSDVYESFELSQFKYIFFYDYVIYLIANLLGDYSYGYFIWLFFPLFVLFYYVVFDDNKRITALFFIFILLSIGVRNYLDLNRSTAGSLLFITSILLFKRNKILSLCFGGLAVITHVFSLYILSISLIVYFFNKKCFPLYKYNYLIVFVLFLFSTLVVARAMSFLPERTVELYLGDSAFGSGSGVNSGAMFLMGRINLLVLILEFLFISKNYKLIDNKFLLSFFFSCVYIVVVFLSFWTISERFSNVALIVGAIIITSNWNECNKVPLYRTIFIQFLVLLFLMRSSLLVYLEYSARYIHNSASKDVNAEMKIFTRPIYMPTVLLLDIKQFGFSNEKYLYLYDRASTNK